RLAIERDQLADVLGGVRREGRKKPLRARRERRLDIAAGRRPGIEPLARNLHRVRRELHGIEETQMARGKSLLRIVGEAPEDLLDLVDRETGRDVEHDLL